jgi:uncharacterized phage-like protein YoqJ
MTLMVTGHRKLVPAGNVGSPWPEQNPAVQDHHARIHQALFDVIKRFHEFGHKDFISGMALGADMLFASAVLYGKLHNMPIRLIAAVPFKGQESKWPEHSQIKYNKVIAQADIIKIVCGGAYSPRKMQERNMWMVDHSNATLAVWDGKQSGGTYNCLKYAIKQKNQVLVMDPLTLNIKEL